MTERKPLNIEVILDTTMPPHAILITADEEDAVRVRLSRDTEVPTGRVLSPSLAHEVVGALIDVVAAENESSDESSDGPTG
jgi:hypothetical protein